MSSNKEKQQVKKLDEILKIKNSIELILQWSKYNSTTNCVMYEDLINWSNCLDWVLGERDFN